MKKYLGFVLAIPLVLAACGNYPSETVNLETNPLNFVGGAVLEDEFSKHSELKEAGWKYLAPGVAVRDASSGQYGSFINYDLITQESLDRLKADTSNSGSRQALKEIEAVLAKFSNGSVTEFRKKYASANAIVPQNSADVGPYYRTLYGCSGNLTAGPLNPGDGAKAFVKYECKGNFQAVAEMYAAAGSDGKVNYKAVQGRLNYQIVQKTGTSYCQSKALLAIVIPGSTTITGGVNVGGEILKSVNGQASYTSSVTYNQPAKITYTVGWPDNTGSGC